MNLNKTIHTLTGKSEAKTTPFGASVKCKYHFNGTYIRLPCLLVPLMNSKLEIILIYNGNKVHGVTDHGREVGTFFT